MTTDLCCIIPLVLVIAACLLDLHISQQAQRERKGRRHAYKDWR